MAKHVWKEAEYGGVDIFAYESGFHNGPECIVCGKAACHHCNPEIYEEECRGPNEIKMQNLQE